MDDTSRRMLLPLLPYRGCATVFILIIFYTAPLSVLAEVFRTRSSAALYLPFAVMNAVNGLLWTAYGLAVPDAFIYGPNMVGIVLLHIQLVLQSSAQWLFQHN